MGDSGRKNLLAYLSKTKGEANTENFSNRINVQKKIYLLQKLGLDMKYDFGWYLYGPYSQELTRDIYNKEALLGTTNDNPAKTKLPNKDEKILSQLNEILSNFKEEELNYWLELLASLQFLESKSKLKEKKPGKFKDEDIERCWKILVEYKLVR